MKILITNDDSVSSKVLIPLAKWAKQFGEVTVVVPKFEQSGKSHSIEIRKPLIFFGLRIFYACFDIDLTSEKMPGKECIEYVGLVTGIW